MNQKICDILFGSIVLFLIFNKVPANMNLRFWGGPFGEHLSIYPLIVGIGYTLYCQWKYRNVFVYYKNFLVFFFIYILVGIISIIWGLYTYPYYGEIFSGPIEQIEKLPYILHWLKSYNIEVDVVWLTGIWMGGRMIKSFLLEALFSWGGVYIIFCWYFSKFEHFKKILFYGVAGSLGVTILYSFIEIQYLIWGNFSAKTILETVNPFLFPIQTGFGWWPPLLWVGQLRSVFAEPSFFSIWSAFATPLLIYFFFTWRKKRTWTGIILFIFFNMIFLTRARTGVALLLGELLLFTLYFLWNYRACLLKRWSIVLMLAMTALVVVSNIDVVRPGPMIKENENISDAEIYLQNNLGSISNVYAFSNAARYGSTLAELYIGLEHPILGVGRGLSPAYKVEYLPDFALQSMVVQNWLNHQKKEGILKSPMPSLCVYTQRFAEGGLLGLGLYLFPIGYLLCCLLKRMFYKRDDFLCACLTVSLCGLLASGLSNSWTVTYCLWVILAAGYLRCFSKEKNE